MKNFATIFKYAALVFIVLAVIWFFRCGNSAGGGKINDTLSHTIDTVLVKTVDTVLLDNPVPYKVTYVREVVKHDTLETIQTVLQHIDSARILAQYLAVRSYDTTVVVKYGELKMSATITQNRITNASFRLSQQVPEIRETITLREKKRNVGYVGIVSFGNQNNIPYATGLSLGMKIKNDAMFEVMGLLTKDQAMYGVGLKWPIRFKKK